VTRKAWTLIEIIVVVTIIIVILIIVAVRANRVIERSRIAKTIIDLEAIRGAINSLYTDTGRFPNGCIPFRGGNPETWLDTDWAGLVKKPPLGRPPGDTGTCIWTQGHLDAWDGPYLEHGNVTDFWQTSYFYDPDYAFCRSSQYPINDCDPDDQVVGECKQACPALDCVPQVVQSLGPDRIPYTCDDIIVQLTLD
jgi:type II secretory pathway pseudopilin PulG